MGLDPKLVEQAKAVRHAATVTKGKTISDKIGEAITRQHKRYAKLGKQFYEAETGDVVRLREINKERHVVDGRIDGLALALAIIRFAPEKPTSEQISAIRDEFLEVS